MTALLEHVRRTMATTAFRIAAASAAGFLIVAAVIAGILFWQTNKILTEHVIAGLRSEASELARVAATDGLDVLSETVRGRSRQEGGDLYFLSDAGGHKIAGNLNRLPPELTQSPQGGVFRYESAGIRGDASRLGVAMPVQVGPDAHLVIGRDIEGQLEYAARIKRIFLWGYGALSIAAILAGLAIGRAVLRRIETITATSRSIMAGDLSRRIPRLGSGDELDELAASLNAMLERIEQLMAGLREVSDNIAHDLKTPLNRLRNRAEAALRDARGGDAYREGLERTIEEADDLIKTFNALLLIARLEAGAVEESAGRFDLGDLVRDVAELYEPVAEEAGIGLDIAVEDGIVIKANRQLVGQAVANLADNAIKYSRLASGLGEMQRITVSMAAKGQSAEIRVGDHGPGIAEKDRERVLKRFVRLEECRTQPGTGLGLSLVAAVARLHGGTIRLEDNEPGLRAVLTLPRWQHADGARSAAE